MIKNKFLNQLEKRLEILNEEERKDIIEEYRANIEDKINHGKTEEEAVADFGNIDDLVKEIMKAYKINPNYQSPEQKEPSKKVKEVMEDTDSWIKSAAGQLSDATKKIVDDFKQNEQELTTQLIFEIIIKAIILLFGLALLKLPFMIIEEMGKSILEMAIYPLDSVLIALWGLLVGIIYFVFCVLIGIIVFKPYFTKKSDSSKKKVKKAEENKEELVTITHNRKEPSAITSLMMGILKVFVILCILIPLWGVNVAYFIGIGVLIFFLIQGIDVVGLLFIVLALTILSTTITDLVTKIFFTHKKVNFIPFLISPIILVVGILLTTSTVLKFDYNPEPPFVEYQLKEEEYHEALNGKNLTIGYYGDNPNIIIDSSVKPDHVKIHISYYDHFIEVNPNFEEDNDIIYLRMNTSRCHNHENKKELYQLMIDDLKQYKWHNIEQIYQPQITIYVNEVSKDNIKIMK